MRYAKARRRYVYRKALHFSTSIGEECGYVIENASVDPVDLMWVNRYLHRL